MFPLISKGGKVIVKEERLSVFSFSPFCKSLMKAQVKFTAGETGLSGGGYGAFPPQQWILAWYWQVTSSSHPAVGDLPSPDLEASIRGALEQSGILQPGKGMILGGMWQRPTKSGVAWREWIGTDCSYLFPCKNWGRQMWAVASGFKQMKGGGLGCTK